MNDPALASPTAKSARQLAPQLREPVTEDEELVDVQ
jgi:hypothetical protein